MLRLSESPSEDFPFEIVNQLQVLSNFLLGIVQIFFDFNSLMAIMHLIALSFRAPFLFENFRNSKLTVCGATRFTRLLEYFSEGLERRVVRNYDYNFIRFNGACSMHCCGKAPHETGAPVAGRLMKSRLV